MQDLSLPEAFADLAHEVRLLGDRIRSVAPAPLDEFGRAANLGALGARQWALGGGKALGLGPWALRDGSSVVGRPSSMFDRPSSANLAAVGASGGGEANQHPKGDAAKVGSRVLRHIEDRSLNDWISSEVLAYDRKELREAMAKLRGMLRKLLEDTFKQIVEGLNPSKALGLGPWAPGGELGKVLGAGTLGTALGLGPLALGPKLGVDGFLDYARNDTRPLAEERSATDDGRLSPASEPLTSHDSPLTGAAGPHQEIHFHIHDAAAVGPILRNKNAMLVRTSALVDRQRAVTRRPRGR